MLKGVNRWRLRNKAMNFIPEDIEILKKQENATEKLKLIYKEIDTKELSGAGLHAHICTFEMLSNDKMKQRCECKKWLKQHPIEYPTNDDFWEPCDFCEMMNYVALDDEGKIMYVSRATPEELINWTKRFKEANNVSL